MPLITHRATRYTDLQGVSQRNIPPHKFNLLLTQKILTPCTRPAHPPLVIFSRGHASSLDIWRTGIARPYADLAPAILSSWCPRGKCLGVVTFITITQNIMH